MTKSTLWMRYRALVLVGMLVISASDFLLADARKELIVERQQMVQSLRAILDDASASKEEKEAALVQFREQQQDLFRRFEVGQPSQQKRTLEPSAAGINWDEWRAVVQRLNLTGDQLALALARIDMLEAVHTLRAFADAHQLDGAMNTRSRSAMPLASSEAIKAQQAVVAAKREQFIALQKAAYPQGARADAIIRIDPEALALARQELQAVLQHGSEAERHAAVKKYQETVHRLRSKQ